MEYFKQWAACVIISFAAVAILKFLLPSGRAGKAADIVLSLIISAALLSPFSEFSSSEEITDGFDFFEDITEESADSAYSEAIKESVESALGENGISYESVEVDMNIDSDGYININEIKIELEDVRDEEKARDAVCSKLGIDGETLSMR